MTTIAIDFGTSRTKLAYRNARGDARLLRFEREEFAPSLFYLPRGSDTILWGDEAAARADEDPAGVVEVLKRKLRDPRIRANQRSEPPARLLTHMLADLRARTAEIAASSGTAATAVTLTLPAMYGPFEEKLLREAAIAAGFTEVDVVAEPVAAARAWLAETGERVDEVVVFDAGGGTLDWAFLRRDGVDFRVVPDCPPGGDAKVGGWDVDQELLEIVRERLAADGGPVEFLGERPAHWRGELRRIKERFGRGAGVPPLRINGRTICLSEADVQAAIEQRFIDQACVGLGPYLEKVRGLTGGRTPPLLLGRRQRPHRRPPRSPRTPSRLPRPPLSRRFSSPLVNGRLAMA